MPGFCMPGHIYEANQSAHVTANVYHLNVKPTITTRQYP